MENNLKKEIVQTLIRFNLFHHPLSAVEIYKFLGTECSYSDLLNNLDTLVNEDKVKHIRGFYCLPGREEVINERFKKLNYFKAKIKKAKRFAKLVSIFPFIEAISISNIIGDHNLKKGSDIDFFIISRPGSLWLTRFFCTFWAKILGLRPNNKTKEDKICLSFYISSDNLNLEKYLYNQDDFYFKYWLVGLEPIFARKNFWLKFWKNNLWIKKYLPNFILPIPESILDIEILGEKKNKCNKITGYLEKKARIHQMKIMPNKLKEQAGNSTGVILDSDIIKLILEDRRDYFIKQYSLATVDLDIV